MLWKRRVKRRVFFDVLLVLGKRGGADGAQLATRQGGLEQVGRIARACSTTRAHERVGLVNEQNDRLFRWPALHR
jgi:hypothetical protein